MTIDISNHNNRELVTVILKYIDDTIVIANIDKEDNIYIIQNKIEDIYYWEIKNNMKYKVEKFMNLRIGPNSSKVKEITLLSIPRFVEPIK